jgi:hypothetical protein
MSITKPRTTKSSQNIFFSIGKTLPLIDTDNTDPTKTKIFETRRKRGSGGEMQNLTADEH